MPGFSDFIDAFSGKDLQQGLNQYLNAPITAAQIQANAQLKAEKMQLGMFNKIVGQEQPFMQGGYASENSLRNLLGLNGASGDRRAMQTLQNLPGYKFTRQQGDLATQSAASVTGSALGGAGLKSLANYNQGLASQYYNSYVNNLLQNTNIGLNAASNSGSAGTSLGAGAASALAGSGASLGAGVMGQAQNMGNLAQGIGSIIGAFM